MPNQDHQDVQMPYGVRLEKKIDQMCSEVGELTKIVIRQSERYENFQSQSVANRRDIDLLQADMNQAKGGLTIAKLMGGGAIGIIITFGTLVLQGYSNISQKLNDASQKSAILESKQIRMDTDLAAMRGQLDQQKK
ncbi:hypothetical protein NVV24_13455 [Acinetobacter radioresistens]|nr:hypothetical protein [Acinetobacter radioresistens]MCX0343645.1 hypothetical protein [Acinetobacter radioresistens]